MTLEHQSDEATAAVEKAVTALREAYTAWVDSKRLIVSPRPETDTDPLWAQLIAAERRATHAEEICNQAIAARESVLNSLILHNQQHAADELSD